MGELAKRNYQADDDIFATRRADHEQLWTVSLWDRDLWFMNIMPKLNFSYKKVSSNINFYEYSERNVWLSFDKRF